MYVYNIYIYIISDHTLWDYLKFRSTICHFFVKVTYLSMSQLVQKF